MLTHFLQMRKVRWSVVTGIIMIPTFFEGVVGCIRDVELGAA